MDPEDIIEDPETILTYAQVAIVGVFAFSLTYTVLDVTDKLFFQRKRDKKFVEEVYANAEETAKRAHSPLAEVMLAAGKDHILETIYESPNLN